MTKYPRLLEILSRVLDEPAHILGARVLRVSSAHTVLDHRLDAELRWLEDQPAGSEEARAYDLLCAAGEELMRAHANGRAFTLFGMLCQDTLSRVGTCNTEVIRRVREGRKNKKGRDAANEQKKEKESTALITDTIIEYYRTHPDATPSEASHFLVEEAPVAVRNVFLRLKGPIDAARNRVNRLRKNGTLARDSNSQERPAARAKAAWDSYSFEWPPAERSTAPSGLLAALLGPR